MDYETRVLLCEAVAVSLVAHTVIRRYWVACAVAAVTAPIVYFVASFIRLGLPPAKLMWFPQVLFGGGLYSLPTAAVIGLPFLAWRGFVKRNRGLPGT